MLKTLPNFDNTKANFFLYSVIGIWSCCSKFLVMLQIPPDNMYVALENYLRLHPCFESMDDENSKPV
ncbi:hypothetical protein JHK84_041151 [Glycine max]|nr:hypothetical protein JHK86_040941 [Glycine max]KAG4966577.1 hypothetical protein JHK85_041552 [Glycine max]KAG5122811.1 hypothetical protein JHK84_041151 [Glycine max]